MAIQVEINGELRQCADALSVLQLLQELGYADQRGLAVAVNNAVHPRSGWARQQLADGDQVTLIRAVAGG